MDGPFYAQKHNEISKPYEMKTFSLLNGCRVQCHLPIPPPPKQEIPISDRPYTSFTYNFALELDIIAEMEEERRQKEKEQRERERLIRERNLSKQEEAWKRLEEEKRKVVTNTTSKKPTNPDTLIDLDFDDETPPPSREHIPSFEWSKPTLPVIESKDTTSSNEFASPNTNKLVSRLNEMGISSEIIRMGIEIVGTDDDAKLINFVTDYIKLEELIDESYSPLVKYSLLLHQNDLQKSEAFLKQIAKLPKKRYSVQQIVEALSMFDNNVEASSKFLEGMHKLHQLGFEEIKIKEALVMSNNEEEKAIQYLLG
eukprot:TRINITY_DN8363_c0_g1_i1.p1 TRINITY_DN8363_c0_g1~~TRINITY_DN8363_c0_g1_i1.p1  ORF type:complete len:312 (-),score=75.13 TRINITY_DN8363_c0_g1_i1:52-987(-)